MCLLQYHQKNFSLVARGFFIVLTIFDRKCDKTVCFLLSDVSQNIISLYFSLVTMITRLTYYILIFLAIYSIELVLLDLIQYIHIQIQTIAMSLLLKTAHYKFQTFFD